MYLSSEGRRAAGRETTEPPHQTGLPHQNILLQEMQHRVANSLQIIAGILMRKAQTTQSEESRSELRDAYHRILAVAKVQGLLQAWAQDKPIELGPHLSKLRDRLAASMIGDGRRISLRVVADAGKVPPDNAMRIGLIITELVINALKYAFPSGSGTICVRYAVDGANWRLSVSDNGVGLQKDGRAHAGLGTTIVAALAKQLNARLEISSDPRGTAVSITCRTKTADGLRWPVS